MISVDERTLERETDAIEPLLVIDNYDSFTYNLVQLLRGMTNKKVIVRRNDRISLQEIIEMSPSGIIISPGPGHPANQSDFGISRETIENQTAIACPILGVCLGHQGIAHVFGARVESAGKIMHGKTSTLELVEDSQLWKGLPVTMEVMRYHSLSVAEESLPDCLRVTARDKETGTIMAIEHRMQKIFGLQFHPESIGTAQGSTIVSNFLALCKNVVKQAH
ncbi:MAG: aminodeoxychorismate/anthranilate synthase component II [Cyanobacteria bacterium]|nr:aminodeoxychorismate/anthranilate synthase component II [Cyanobacteriota bacterium]